MAGTRLEERVVRAAEAALEAHGYVSPVDVLLQIGWLAPTDLDRWRQGRVECLERVVQAGLTHAVSARYIDQLSRVEMASPPGRPSLLGVTGGMSAARTVSLAVSSVTPLLNAIIGGSLRWWRRSQHGPGR